MARVQPWPKDEPFEHAPTFDALKERSGLKAYALRRRLREVPCFKCPDNSVRYDEAAANDVLEPDASDDELADVDAPTSSDPTQTALVTTNKTLALFSATLRLLNETIAKMGEPQKRGIEMMAAAQQVLETRLGKYDALWDRMITLVEDLQTTQDEREQKKAQQVQAAAMRKETFEMAKSVLPSALDKFSLTMEASSALELLRSVDPEILEGVLQPGGLVPDEMLPKARKLVELLKQQKQQRQAKQQAEAAKAEPTPASSSAAPAESPPPEAKPNGAAASDAPPA